MGDETARQLFHIGIGLAAIALLLLFGRGVMIALVFFILIGGMLLVNQRKLGRRIALIEWFEERFERPDAPLPGWGSACYAAGVLIALTFLSGVSQVAAVVFVLAIGDGVSTIIGEKFGKMKISYNPKKTVEGSLACFASSLLAYAFIGPAALPLAIIATLAESAPFIDDNILVPIACTALLLII